MRILLVDDSETIRVTVAALLEDAGHVVTEAESLAAARGCLGGAAFDVVLLDVHLGDGLGPTLIPELRATHPAATIALLTGDAAAVKGAADLVLSKATAPLALLARIEQAARR
jgi:two-component system OmpR family response regulator